MDRTMDAKTFLDTHGEDRSRQVAEGAGTKLGYFKQIAYGHRRPSPDLAERLVTSSEGELDFVSLLKSRKAA